MIQYNYRCKECKKLHEINIETHDILDKVGRVDQKELEKRMYKPRSCECGGELYKIIGTVRTALWFDRHNLKGKISRRYS